MSKEKILIDSKTSTAYAKRVLTSESPDDFRPAFGRIGQRILTTLASGPKYPAEIARGD